MHGKIVPCSNVDVFNPPGVDVCMYVWSSHIAEYGSTG